MHRWVHEMLMSHDLTPRTTDWIIRSQYRGVEAPSLQWKMKVYQVVPKKIRQKMVVMWWWWIWMGETSHSIYVLIHHQALASPSCHNHVSVTVWGLAHVLSKTLWRTGTMWPGVCSQTKPSHNKRQGDRKSMTLTYSETGKLELYPDQLNTYTSTEKSYLNRLPWWYDIGHPQLADESRWGCVY